MIFPFFKRLTILGGIIWIKRRIDGIFHLSNDKETYSYRHVQNTGIHHQNDLDELNPATIEECKEKCSSDERCKSFDYIKDIPKCYLSTKSSQDSNVVFGTNDDPDSQLANSMDWNRVDYYEKILGIFSVHCSSNIYFEIALWVPIFY